jgi:hypothetical protein
LPASNSNGQVANDAAGEIAVRTQTGGKEKIAEKANAELGRTGVR